MFARCAVDVEIDGSLTSCLGFSLGFTLLKAMETELGGKAGNAGLFMLGMKLKPYKTIAKLIKQACAGFGTCIYLLVGPSFAAVPYFTVFS